MRTIHKFRLEAKRTQHIEMPVGATILSVGAQSGVAMLWAIVNTNNVLEKRTIHVVLTGDDATELFDARYLRFVGTVLLPGSTFTPHGIVLHVFEEAGPDDKDIV